MLKRTNLLMLIFAILFSLLATYFIMQRVEQAGYATTSSQGTVNVVVLNKDLPVHTLIDASDVSVKSVSRNSVVSGAISSTEQVVGKFTASQLYGGQQVVPEMLVSGTEDAGFALSVPQGQRAFTITNGPTVGVDHKISAGDHVDILASYSDNKSAKQVKTILQNITVLYVDNQPQFNMSKSTVNASNAQNGAATADTIILSVTPEQAETLYSATTSGQIELTLRNPHDDGVAQLTGQSGN